MAILDFHKDYHDEESCKLKFKEVRGKEGITCKRCGCPEHYWKSDKWSYECKKCHLCTSLSSGTVMQSSKLPFHYWFIAMHLMASTRKSFFAKEIQCLLVEEAATHRWNEL